MSGRRRAEHACGLECRGPSSSCEAEHPDGWGCTRLEGHAGPHVACTALRHDLAVWGDAEAKPGGSPLAGFWKGATPLLAPGDIMYYHAPVPTLRDRFAMAAVTGYLASLTADECVRDEVLARNAYEVADAMLAEREKKEAKP